MVSGARLFNGSASLVDECGFSVDGGAFSDCAFLEIRNEL